MDLARVEVLRGPQNILYGKNSIAGALSVITNKPSKEFEAYVSGTYEPEFGEQIFDAVVSGPLSDDFSARLAYRNRQLDGYVENIDGDDEPNRDEETLRLSLAWDITPNLDALLKIEHGSFDVEGRQIEIAGDEASLNPALMGANWSDTLYSLNAGSDTVPASVLDITQNAKRSSNGDFSENTTDNVTLTVNYSANDYTYTSITSHLEYDYDELCDCDFTSADLFFVRSKEEFKQFSQEFRITSPADQTIEWIAGVYYQDSTLDFEDAFFVSQDADLPNLLEGILPTAFSADGGLTTVYNTGAAQQLRGISVPRFFDQDTEVISTFLQGTWNIESNVRLTLGGRYSYEEKEATRVLTVKDSSGNTMPYDELFIPNTYMGIDYLLGAVFKVARNDLEGKREVEKFAPLVSFEVDVSDDVLSYVTWTRGFKSGGYDVRSNAPPQATTIVNPISSALDVTVPTGAFEYAEEEATTLEVGLKTSLADGAAELNMAYFYTQYDDLQVSIYDGVLGFNVGNAAEAITQGVELDGRWLIAEGLTLSGSLAWLDFEFKDYINGQCTQRERITTSLSECDFDGNSNQYVAEWSGAFAADYVVDVADNLQLRTTLDVLFTTDYNPSQNVDPNIEQDGYHKINARIALGDNEAGWEVALVGKNLTDEETISYANDTPLAANLTQSIGYYTLVDPGRSIAIQGLYRF
ncbi:TonB-dependent receptor [Dasania sp. GY-MA-18]|uniref:TonB-dependent receptor n=1 Tax=Dasania phycosphaerae TaxID=2950436 RepID=A0A9J6RLC0_9GAMM|nr:MULTISPECIES: TonB-dependent receptor [Dasania]MCR8922554.1 TonB-dependent receptor [Dasania sp. GY-MA-18]MCZ0864983.1 TonB-dependent receptor [Dasania phycosphaerae]MCZ0868710.1 TonB-dependent receptor [Dasania phycosphaerae]